MSDATASKALDADAPVFDRLGNIVRSLHDALRELGAEQVLAEAASEFPSTRERLLHIDQLTEKAANTVLGKVEETGPIQERLVEGAEKLSADWNNLPTLSQVPDSLKPLIDQTKQFISSAQGGCHTTRAALSDMMMAQDFQDLTGQLIKKVVSLLERTENDLLKLLIDAAPPGAICDGVKPDQMKVRRRTAEHVFGTLKHWMGSTHFQMRALEKVDLHALAYNLKLVMQLLGIPERLRQSELWGCRPLNVPIRTVGNCDPHSMISPTR